MDRKRYRRAAAIFDRARRVPPSPRRDAAIAKACAGDDELQAEVLSLLRHHEEPSAFLSDDAAAPTCVLQDPPEPELPSRIGPYRLLEVIGEGGMGTVYLAEQTEPVERRVALKLIKLGMDTREVVARFRSEMQALALMDHPNIARVHDAGATDDGRPYFVMEHIPGVPITEHCDTCRLGTKERLQLFVTVCEAVQHAHQKAIIHRDLKPSNVLVMIRDGKPVVKIIDFGIAKATNRRLCADTVYTELGQIVGTPEYMSPEQAGRTAQDVDTRSDVYSLGVLLYELLVGTLPFDREDLLQGGIAEIQRIIREVEPPKPSTRLSRLGKTTTSIAAKRRTSPAALARQLRGDLDWITMKAMEKDRTRRYESAAALARDVERHLRHETVEAGPPSRRYRLRKFVRRNRVAVLASTVVVLSLLAGLTLASVGFLKAADERDAARIAEGKALAAEGRERTAREKAEDARRGEEAQRRAAEESAKKARREAETTRRVVELFKEMLGSADPRKVKGPGYTVRELLDDFSLKFKEQLEEDPRVEAVLRQTVARAYAGLGRFGDAEPHLERALELVRHDAGEESPEFVHLLGDLGGLRQDQGHLEEAEELFKRVLVFHESSRGEEYTGTLAAMNNLAAVYEESGRPKKAMELCERVLEIQRKTFGDEHPGTLVTAHNKGLLLWSLGRYDEAKGLLETTLEIQKRVRGEAHPDTLSSMHYLACVYHSMDRFAEAKDLFDRSLELRRSRMGPEHPKTLESMQHIAERYRESGNLSAAEPLIAEVCEVRERNLGPMHPHTLSAMAGQADLRLAQKRYDEAKQLYRQVLEKGQGVVGAEQLILSVLNNLALCHQDQGEFEEATRLYAKLLDCRKRLAEDDHPETLTIMHNLASLYMAQARFADAEPLLVRVLEVRKRTLGEEHSATLRSMDSLAQLYLMQRRFAEAEPLLKQALEIQRRVLGEDHPGTLCTLNSLGFSYQAQKKYAQCVPVFQEAWNGLKRVYGEDHPNTLMVLNNMGTVSVELGRDDEAEPILRRVLAARIRILGEDNPDTLNSFNCLATLCYKQKRYDSAVSLYHKALKHRFEKLGWEHPDTMATLHGLAMALCRQGAYAKAEPLLLRWHALAVKTRVSSSLRQSVEKDLVELYEAWEKPEEADRWRARLEAEGGSEPRA